MLLSVVPGWSIIIMLAIRLSQTPHITKLRSGVKTIKYLSTLRIPSRKSISSNLLPHSMSIKPYSMSIISVQPITHPFYTAWTSISTLLFLTLWVQQISAAPVIIPKHGTKPMERALTTTTGAVLVTTIRITTIKRMLVALKHKKGNKNKCYRLYQQ